MVMCDVQTSDLLSKYDHALIGVYMFTILRTALASPLKKFLILLPALHTIQVVLKPGLT